MVSMLPIAWLVVWPWWAVAALIVAVVVVTLRWRVPQPRELQLRDHQLTVVSEQVQTLERPGRVLRLGPWLAMQTPKGWVHLFDDQAPQDQLQPIYQWLWVHRLK